jgi:hypothetical protein
MFRSTVPDALYRIVPSTLLVVTLLITIITLFPAVDKVLFTGVAVTIGT